MWTLHIPCSKCKRHSNRKYCTQCADRIELLHALIFFVILWIFMAAFLNAKTQLLLLLSVTKVTRLATSLGDDNMATGGQFPQVQGKLGFNQFWIDHKSVAEKGSTKRIILVGLRKQICDSWMRGSKEVTRCTFGQDQNASVQEISNTRTHLIHCPLSDPFTIWSFLMRKQCQPRLFLRLPIGAFSQR